MPAPRRARWFQFSLSSLFLGMTVVAVWYGWGPSFRAWLAVRQLSNADVHFAGSHSGFAVGIQGATAQRLRTLGKRANPALRSALSDPHRFAAAHVLLSEINGMPKYGTSPPDISEVLYNQLRIRPDGAGKASFPREQMPHLEQHWREQLAR